MVKEYGLDNYVSIYDQGMSPEEVRKHMEASEIYLFTSDKGEGWGVVLNEALNSACAVIASYSAGSTPFLMEDEANGLVYRNDDYEQLLELTKKVLDDADLKKKLAYNAYKSIVEEWNCEVAAERFYQVADRLLNHKDISDMYEKGIFSRAVPIK